MDKVTNPKTNVFILWIDKEYEMHSNTLSNSCRIAKDGLGWDHGIFEFGI